MSLFRRYGGVALRPFVGARRFLPSRRRGTYTTYASGADAVIFPFVLLLRTVYESTVYTIFFLKLSTLRALTRAVAIPFSLPTMSCV